MSFIKRDVKDRVVQYPRRYQLVEVSQGVYDLVPVTGVVTEEGTAINKAYLQPIEDGLDAALEKTGDGKDVTVTFTEAATEAHIASGEKLSVMFGKILKMFKGKAPNSHASSGTTYGVGTTTNYGHCKTINGLTQSSHVNGNALSAYQGKVLNDKFKVTLLKTINIPAPSPTTPVRIPVTDDFSSWDELIFELDGTFTIKSTTASQRYHTLSLTSPGTTTSKLIFGQFNNNNSAGVQSSITVNLHFPLYRRRADLERDGTTTQNLVTVSGTTEVPTPFDIYIENRAENTCTSTLKLKIYGRNYSE